MDGDELDLRPILDSLRRRALILILFALAGALCALVLTRFFMQPVYRSSARILVEAAQAPALTAAGAIPVAADTYVELVRGDWLKHEVARRLELPASEGLPFELTARSVRGTQMVVLDAESPDPKLAAESARVALSVLQELVRQRQSERFAAAEQRLEAQIGELTAELNRVRAALSQARSESERAALSDQASRLQAALGQLQASYGNLKLAQAQAGDLIIVLESPATPERPVRPVPLLNGALGGSLGLLLGVSYAAAAAVLDRRFRDIKQVEETLKLPVLAALYREDPGSEGGVITPRPFGFSGPTSGFRRWTGPLRSSCWARRSRRLGRPRWPWASARPWRPWASGLCWWRPTCGGPPCTEFLSSGVRRDFQTGW